jgi:WD40 repeat protein
MRRITVGLLLAALLTMCGGPAGPPAVSPSQTVSTERVVLPSPIPQQLTRTSPAAQVAWVEVKPNAGLVLGIDPTGRIVGRIERALGRFYRSATGEEIFVLGDRITSYPAMADLQGPYTSPTRSFGETIKRGPGEAVGGAVIDAKFSPDGSWLAVLGSLAYLELVDLRSGRAQTTPIAHDANAAHPGLTCSSCDANTLLWSSLVFSPDSKRLYAIVDWGGPLRLTAFDVTPKGLVQSASSVTQTLGSLAPANTPACGGPAIAAGVVNAGRTLAVFCYFDAQVMFFETATLRSTGVLRAQMKNPFWIAPIFTPDGQLLFLRQYPSFGDQVQVVDLRSQKLLGPVPTPQKVGDPAPFSWRSVVAYAGGTPSTVPVSPDGTKIYTAGPDGISVLRIPDLKPIAQLAAGMNINEVWVSGDGRTIYATQQGKALLIIAADGSSTKRVDLDVYGFIASDRP